MSTSMNLGPPTLPFPIQFVKALTLSPPSPPKGWNLAGQVGIVTGGNRGLGFESADILLTHKLSHLIITVRNAESGKEALAKLKKSYPDAKIEIWLLDMALYNSIETFVKRCAELPRIDFVILNAGLLNSDFILNETTKQEMQIQVNYLSTVLLTFLLLPVLKGKRHITGNPGRITIAGSGLAFVAKFPERTAPKLMTEFAKQPPKPWNLSVSMDRYSNTKLMLLMFILKLREHVSEDEVVVNVADPGFIGNTGFDRTVPAITRIPTMAVRKVIGRGVRPGAWTLVDAATLKPKSSHGSWTYCWEVFS